MNCGERNIISGSPQGSILGCLLYCITTQTLTDSPENQAQPQALPTNLDATPVAVGAVEMDLVSDRRRVRNLDTILVQRFFQSSDSEDDNS